jgi:hypothetical protein
MELIALACTFRYKLLDFLKEPIWGGILARAAAVVVHQGELDVGSHAPMMLCGSRPSSIRAA